MSATAGDRHRPELDAPSEPSAATRRPRLDRFQADVLAAVAAGGALGAPARYEVTRLVHVAPGTFPWSTFWTNVTGSLALGFVLVVVAERFPPTRYLRPFFATGFLGAYTTFSTFMVESATLTKDGHGVVAGTYLLASVATGFAAVWAGIVAGLMVSRRSHHPTGRLTP